jgi:hypothetical protein
MPLHSAFSFEGTEGAMASKMQRSNEDAITTIASLALECLRKCLRGKMQKVQQLKTQWEYSFRF